MEVLDNYPPRLWIGRLAPVGHSGELALAFPLLLFVPGNLGFFFGIRIIDQRHLRFLGRASDQSYAACQKQ